MLCTSTARTCTAAVLTARAIGDAPEDLYNHAELDFSEHWCAEHFYLRCFHTYRCGTYCLSIMFAPEDLLNHAELAFFRAGFLQSFTCVSLLLPYVLLCHMVLANVLPSYGLRLCLLSALKSTGALQTSPLLAPVLLQNVVLAHGLPHDAPLLFALRLHVRPSYGLLLCMQCHRIGCSCACFSTYSPW